MGIVLTGVTNWAPSKDLATLLAAPTNGVHSSSEAGSESQWVTLAGLNVSFGAGYGIAVNADFAVSLDRGKFILTLKAALLLGEGITGSFGLEVGHEAVIQIINLFRRELHKNEGKKVTWMIDETAAHASKLNLLGAAGIDVVMIYMIGGLDIVMSLYEALTSGRRGCPIAHTIMTYSNPDELEEWFVNATPSSLGPMLMTLTTEATAFSVTSTFLASDGTAQPSEKSYDQAQAYLVQQQALDTYWAGSQKMPLTIIP
jgi:hypothetical protein